jgi:hypothetical protein
MIVERERDAANNKRAGGRRGAIAARGAGRRMEGEGGRKRGESVVFDHYGVGFVRPSSLALPAFLLNAVWRSLLLTPVPSCTACTCRL